MLKEFEYILAIFWVYFEYFILYLMFNDKP